MWYRRNGPGAGARTGPSVPRITLDLEKAPLPVLAPRMNPGGPLRPFQVGGLWEFHQQDSGKRRKGWWDRRRSQHEQRLGGLTEKGGEAGEAGGCLLQWRPGLSCTHRDCWEARTPRALTVLRLLSPEKVPAGKGKKALVRLTWGRSTCFKSWDPGCQQILTAAGSETRSPQHLRVLHASPTAPMKGGRGGPRGGQAWGSLAAAAPRA